MSKLSLNHPALTTFEYLATGVILLNSEGKIIWANGSVQSLTERSLKTLQQCFLEQLFIDGRHVKRVLQSVLSGEVASISFEAHLIKPFNHIPIVLNLQYRSSADNAWVVVVEVHDLAHYLAVERNETLARELATYQESFRNLAHEVKNPLGGIRGAAQLLGMELSNRNEDLTEYTQVIINEADRLQNLLDRLMHNDNSTTLDLQLMNIHEVCEHVYSLLVAEYRDRVEIVRDYDASLPELRIDKDKMIQVYLNLARNAAQSLVENPPQDVEPTLTLRTRIAYRRMIANKIHRQVIALSVIDNGVGVPESIKDKIFHPLVTGRAEGTGLGLNLAQELARIHGGLISFESIPGYTEFELLLPIDIA